MLEFAAAAVLRSMGAGKTGKDMAISVEGFTVEKALIAEDVTVSSDNSSFAPNPTRMHCMVEADGVVEISSSSDDAGDVKHADGRASQSCESEADRTLWKSEFESLRGSCVEAADARQMYASLASAGLMYGPSFQLISEAQSL
jgi:hypothetical protein